jgi:hypothetical protein
MRFGAKNSQWKGGRVIASNGYVLLRMPGHHLADVRGYVYEHRLVAEQKLGRRLLTGERPHHLNHDKTDNRAENLQICGTEAEHHALHRRLDRGLRLPGTPNPAVLCECGCGSAMSRYDAKGRPRRFLLGHCSRTAAGHERLARARRLPRFWRSK